MNMIDNSIKQVVQDTDFIIKEVVAEAKKLMGANRQELGRVRSQIAAIDTELELLAKRLMDPDLTEPATKRLLSKQVADKSEQRERLEERLANLADEANDNTEHLADAVRQAIAEMKESLANVASDSEFNQFVQNFVGHIVIDENGSIQPKEQRDPRDQLAEAIQYRRLDRKL